MATNVMLWLPAFVLFLGGGAGGDAIGVSYTNEIGVKEATGNNDGPRVAEYLRYCGLGEGYDWCAAFVSWCHGQAGYDQPRNAWAAALFPKARVVWQPNRIGAIDPLKETPRRGDVFGIHIQSKKRIAHCGFVDAWDGTWCLTVEGNVDNAVVRKRRSVKTIHAVARWQKSVETQCMTSLQTVNN